MLYIQLLDLSFLVQRHKYRSSPIGKISFLPKHKTLCYSLSHNTSFQNPLLANDPSSVIFSQEHYTHTSLDCSKQSLDITMLHIAARVTHTSVQIVHTLVARLDIGDSHVIDMWFSDDYRAQQNQISNHPSSRNDTTSLMVVYNLKEPHQKWALIYLCN